MSSVGCAPPAAFPRGAGPHCLVSLCVHLSTGASCFRAYAPPPPAVPSWCRCHRTGASGVPLVSFTRCMSAFVPHGGVNQIKAAAVGLSPMLSSISLRRPSGSMIVRSTTTSAFASSAYGPDPSLKVAAISTATYLSPASSTTVLFAWYLERRSRNHPSFSRG